MSPTTYNPTAIFEQNEVKGGVCEVKDVFAVLAAGTLSQTILNGIAGKQFIILHGQAVSANGLLAGLALRSNTTQLKGLTIPAIAATVPSPNIFFGGEEWGYYRTATSAAIQADTYGAGTVWLSLTYIEVTA